MQEFLSPSQPAHEAGPIVVPAVQMSKLRLRGGGCLPKVSWSGSSEPDVRLRDTRLPTRCRTARQEHWPVCLWSPAGRLEGALEGVGVPGRVSQTWAASFCPCVFLGSPGLPSSAHHPGGHTHHLTVTTQRGQGWHRGAQGPRQPERCLIQPGCQGRLPKGGDTRAI